MYQKERLSRTPTARLDRRSTNPSPSLQQRYFTALRSQRQPSSDYRLEQAYTSQPLQEEDLRGVEKALSNRLSSSSVAPSESTQSSIPPPGRWSEEEKPQIRVRASSNSISIIIPEGFQLPLVATISSAGSFETQMSSIKNDQESEVTNTSGETSRPTLRPRRVTISGQSTTSSPDCEVQDISAGFALPFLARISEGRLNVSEASISAPQYSDISAQGQVFAPSHQVADEVEAPRDADDDNPSTSPTPTTVDPDNGAATRSTSAPPGIVGEHDSTSSTTVDPEPLESNRTKNENQQQTLIGPANLVPTPASKSDRDVNQLSDGLPTNTPFNAFELPQIRVHRPSGTIITAMSSPGVPPTPAPSAVDQIPGTAQAPLDASPFTNPVTPLPAGLPNVSAVADALPLNAATNALPVVPQLGIPGLSGKISRRRKVVQKVRKTVIRKKLLQLIIGRDLANLVHPVLNEVSTNVPTVLLAMDGAADPLDTPSRRKDWRREHYERLSRVVIMARLAAEEEERGICARCDGLINTRNHQRLYRLELLRDNPRMRFEKRYVAALGKAEPLECRCPRITRRRAKAG